MHDKLHLGVGREIITPPLGTFLSGYSTSDRDAVAVNDDLTVTVFYFEKDGTRAMLISFALNLLDKDICDTVRYRVEQEHGIPYSNIILHTIHTHSAPLTFTTKGWGYSNANYVNNILIPKTLIAVKCALINSTAVGVSVTSADSYVGINRRETTRENEIVLGQDPHGYFDPKMTVISFADELGRCVANIVHYGCHATASGSNLEITRDWPGVMIDRLETESGGITAFINGAEGDVGPRLTNGFTTGRGDIRYALEHGAVAAADAVSIYKKGAIYRDVDLKCTSRTLKLPVEKRISLDEAKYNLETVTDKNPQHLNRIRMHYEEILQSYQTDYKETEFMEIEQVAIRIGEVTLYTSPFETFSEISLHISKYSGISNALCVSMSNGYESYFPTKREISRGGYEAKCFKTERVQPLSDDADFAFITETLETFKQL